MKQPFDWWLLGFSAFIFVSFCLVFFAAFFLGRIVERNTPKKDPRDAKYWSEWRNHFNSK